MITDPSLLSHLLQHISKASPMKSDKKREQKERVREEEKIPDPGFQCRKSLQISLNEAQSPSQGLGSNTTQSK